MPFQKVEFEFPDEQEESTEIEIESSSAETLGAEKEEVSNEVELEVVDDDIPAKDKDETGQLRKPGKPPEDLTDDELEGVAGGGTAATGCTRLFSCGCKVCGVW